MHFLRRLFLVRAFELFDVVVLGAALLAAKTAALAAPDAAPADALAAALPAHPLVAGAALLLSWHAISAACRLYSSRRLSQLRAEVRDVAVATGYATVAAAAILAALEGFFSWVFVGAFLALALAALVVSRLMLRALLVEVRLHGRNLRHVVVVGTNQAALEYARFLRERPELGYVLSGFVDEPDAAGRLRPVDRLVSGYDGFPAFLRTNAVDEVVVFAPLASAPERIARILGACQEQGVVARIGGDLFGLTRGELEVERTEGLAHPLVTIHAARLRGWRLAAKRLVDLAGASFALLLAAPVLLAAALAIKLTSPGPVLFVQERIGLNKHRFRLFKFRTMVVGAEGMRDELLDQNEVSGPVFKMRSDPRVTRVGRFLRRTSIDELPQLLNVLRGDMSLVGPRPLPVRDYQGFNEDWHRRRFSVRPGITCLWQVSGRNDIPFERWMELDLEYIENWTLGLDLLILARTVPAVVRATGV